MKSFKDLFIKSDDEEENAPESSSPGFPVGSHTPSAEAAPGTPSTPKPSGNNPYVEEIIQVYDKGLESINMPGYDFFDFYSAIKAAGAQNDSVFRMAFQMGKTMDTGLTPQKLVQDAEFYLSKIRDVHQKYADQGNQKLGDLNSQLRGEKEKLSADAADAESRIEKLKQEIAQQERKLSETRAALTKVDEKYKPQQQVIEQKLEANDRAMEISLQKLTTVKEGIQQFLK